MIGFLNLLETFRNQTLLEHLSGGINLKRETILMHAEGSQTQFLIVSSVMSSATEHLLDLCSLYVCVACTQRRLLKFPQMSCMHDALWDVFHA